LGICRHDVFPESHNRDRLGPGTPYLAFAVPREYTAVSL